MFCLLVCYWEEQLKKEKGRFVICLKRICLRPMLLITQARKNNAGDRNQSSSVCERDTLLLLSSTDLLPAAHRWCGCSHELNEKCQHPPNLISVWIFLYPSLNTTAQIVYPSCPTLWHNAWDTTWTLLCDCC